MSRKASTIKRLDRIKARHKYQAMDKPVKVYETKVQPQLQANCGNKR